ncbi:hypothetical protein G6O69_12980 [Pseudenhygromyxa sp. WMMC2535]|uniref:hypothetical protein n=1 Tax=Pseudenhygromyxa sp. WMMC2535 TaxID=2712867 RepID=UPI00159615D4|nr:hypothetical protein [Pseudenhygromyxa sp. WMMC2535]NVB38747.1 hypothetical protein [Pseudenhygromyxa sp. WMMC2535]
MNRESPTFLLERAAMADQAGDLDGIEAVIGAIELGDGARRDRLLLRGHSQASNSARLLWLAAMERQAIDPGPELLGAALKSTQPEERATGLRLLVVHAERTAHRHTLLPHLFAREPEVRSAAIIAGLVLGLPEAPLLAGQTVRLPGMFAPTCLHATEASPEQLDALLDLCGSDHAPAQLDLALALSGRPRAIAAVLARCGGAALPAELGAAICFAVGFDGHAEVLPGWWSEHGSGFAGQDRLVRGQPATAARLVASLAQASSPVWQALRLELLVRSSGAIRLPARGLPGDLLAAAEAVDPGVLPGLSSD